MATMSPSTDNYSSLGKVETVTPAATELAIYPLAAAKLNEFDQFYTNTILPWMKANNLTNTMCWIVQNSLIVSNPTIPWDAASGLVGLAAFIDQGSLAQVTKLRDVRSKR